MDAAASSNQLSPINTKGVYMSMIRHRSRFLLLTGSGRGQARRYDRGSGSDPFFCIQARRKEMKPGNPGQKFDRSVHAFRVVDLPALGRAMPDGPQDAETGRQRCRGRVGLYVKVWVGA